MRETTREVCAVVPLLPVMISVISWPKVKGLRENSKLDEMQTRYADRSVKSWFLLWTVCQ